MARDLGSLDARIGAGDEAALRGWLAEKVWPLGRSVNGEELVQRVSGEPLGAGPFLRHLEDRLEAWLAG